MIRITLPGDLGAADRAGVAVLTPPSPAMSNSADGLEKTLVDEGRLDSVGGFTLDLKLALRKLSERLLQPEDCLLYLVQSAVASGANWIEVVQYGVSLLPLKVEELPDRLWMLLADTTLATDVTCLKPVTQDALRDRMAPLLEKFDEVSKPYRERYHKQKTGISFEVWLVRPGNQPQSEVD